MDLFSKFKYWSVLMVKTLKRNLLIKRPVFSGTGINKIITVLRFKRHIYRQLRPYLKSSRRANYYGFMLLLNLYGHKGYFIIITLICLHSSCNDELSTMFVRTRLSMLLKLFLDFLSVFLHTYRWTVSPIKAISKYSNEVSFSYCKNRIKKRLT